MSLQFTADPRRVITRLFVPGGPQRAKKIIGRVIRLSDAEARRLLRQILADFSQRHNNIEGVLQRHYAEFEQYLPDPQRISRDKKLLIGAYFTMEYSIESAALFNPSIVLAPDQKDLPPGHARFILSFRATGEGHMSCLEFRGGTLTERGELILDPVCPVLETPRIASEVFYDKDLFGFQLMEMGLPDTYTPEDLQPYFQSNEVVSELLSRLPESFTLEQLRAVMADIRVSGKLKPEDVGTTFARVRWLACSNYRVWFAAGTSLSERVLFPVTENERRGIEDARFVRFVDDGDVAYYATYAAFDGDRAQTQLLETRDFLGFRISTLNGRHANTKGMALFPRRVCGRYAMISRTDGENLFVMYSDDIRFWHKAERIQEPREPWEFVQIGNCGPPIETEAGWLLLTHGVGPMRRYCIGATLLDLDDPSVLLGYTEQPILEPDEREREGYVPNVVYSCGALVHRGQLIIPYAMSDTASSIASVPLGELLEVLLDR
jgi:predicted GH43/DUF377 family glycosyl hydrolase